MLIAEGNVSVRVQLDFSFMEIYSDEEERFFQSKQQGSKNIIEKLRSTLGQNISRILIQFKHLKQYWTFDSIVQVLSNRFNFV